MLTSLNCVGLVRRHLRLSLKFSGTFPLKNSETSTLLTERKRKSKKKDASDSSSASREHSYSMVWSRSQIQPMNSRHRSRHTSAQTFKQSFCVCFFFVIHFFCPLRRLWSRICCARNLSVSSLLPLCWFLRENFHQFFTFAFRPLLLFPSCTPWTY